jgi:hypothetical protein
VVPKVENILKVHGEMTPNRNVLSVLGRVGGGRAILRSTGVLHARTEHIVMPSPGNLNASTVRRMALCGDIGLDAPVVVLSHGERESQHRVCSYAGARSRTPST